MVQKVIFAAFDTTNSIEPWITDGTAAGTMLLKDINPGFSQSLGSTYGFRSLGNKVVFAAATNTDGQELSVTDGTAAAMPTGFSGLRKMTFSGGSQAMTS